LLTFQQLRGLLSILTYCAYPFLCLAKHKNGMPLYRQEMDWGTFGVKVSRATLANWIIYTSRNWLLPLWNSLKTQLLTSPVILADDYRNCYFIETSPQIYA